MQAIEDGTKSIIGNNSQAYNFILFLKRTIGNNIRLLIHTNPIIASLIFFSSNKKIKSDPVINRIINRKNKNEVCLFFLIISIDCLRLI